jgi:predicted nucleic acid-binding protein
MDFVVDTNVLLTFFWKDSVFQKLSMNQDLDLFSLEFALDEIDKNSDEIMKKSRLSLIEFKDFKKELFKIVIFVPLKEYKSFLALCFKLESVLWSNDKQLKKQSKREVLSTSEIIELLDL